MACTAVATRAVSLASVQKYTYVALPCVTRRSVRYPLRRSCGTSFTVRAQKDGDQLVSGAIRMAGGATDTLVSFVPAVVPRPAARIGVIVLGGLFALSLVQKLLSFAFFIAVIGGGGYLFLKSQSGGSGASGASGATFDDEDGALAQAKRIMDKYK